MYVFSLISKFNDREKDFKDNIPFPIIFLCLPNLVGVGFTSYVTWCRKEASH